MPTLKSHKRAKRARGGAKVGKKHKKDGIYKQILRLTRKKQEIQSLLRKLQKTSMYFHGFGSQQSIISAL